MTEWRTIKKFILEWLNRNIKSYHFIILGLILAGWGIYSILEIKNSTWYSGRTLFLGLVFIIMGTYVFAGELKKRKP